MKKLIAAAVVVAALSTASAWAYTCTTTCYWLGDVQYCNESCY